MQDQLCETEQGCNFHWILQDSTVGHCTHSTLPLHSLLYHIFHPWLIMFNEPQQLAETNQLSFFLLIHKARKNMLSNEPKINYLWASIAKIFAFKGQTFGCNVTNPPFIGSQVKKLDHNLFIIIIFTFFFFFLFLFWGSMVHVLCQRR